MRLLTRAARLPLILVLLLGTLRPAEPAWSEPWSPPILGCEDATETDPETGAELRYLTRGEHKDTNLYFHQRSWLADDSLILFFSSRDPGGLMGYVVETGELIAIAAADGTRLRHPTAARLRPSVFALAGDRVVEVGLAVSVATTNGTQRARVMARERSLCTVRGIDVYLNESCDGRYLAAGGRQLESANRPGLVLVDTQSGQPERLCDIPDGVAYHGHVQWSLTNPFWLSFAGEPNRLWVVDIRDRRPWCPYPQRTGELVTHEFWWVNDQLGFCGGVHPKPTEDSSVKLLDLRAGTVRVIGEGSWWPAGTPSEIAKRNWWHASGSEDGRWIAADNWHGDIMLFEGATSRPRLLTTSHRTYGKGEHPEVGWDRRGEQVIFASHRRGGVTVCVATIPRPWQAEARSRRVGLEAK